MAWLPLSDIARGENPRKNVEIVRAIRTTDSRREEKLGWDQALSFGISFSGPTLGPCLLESLVQA